MASTHCSARATVGTTTATCRSETDCETRDTHSSAMSVLPPPVKISRVPVLGRPAPDCQASTALSCQGASS